MKIYVKYIILLAGFGAVSAAISSSNIAAGIAAAGCFIAYAIIEIADMKIMNQEEVKAD